MHIMHEGLHVRKPQNTGKMLAAIGSVWQTHLMFSDTCTKTKIRDCQYECDRIIDNARKIECDFFFFFFFFPFRKDTYQ